MSFSSTPLGQGRRLDHQTFLNKPSRSKAHSPPRRTIPATYAYGGPTLGTRSPPKSQKNLTAPADPSDDTEEPALVRFARLKQREQANINAPSGSQAPASPHPEKWSVKDTSVNIAGAFHTAANTDNNMNPDDSWASSTRRQVLPRSTSVEYEKETQSTVNRRLAPPPSRAGGRGGKPLSKAASIRHVPDSEGEEPEPPRSQEQSRGKSPLEHIIDVAQRYAPTSILMRARSKEPEADQSRSRTNGNGVANESSSYDYSAEERDYQAQIAAERAAPGPTRRMTVAHKRNRMSMDNKAYKPTQSDLEESDEDFDDENGKRTRRKKKGGIGGPPLTSLPVAGYDKRKKKRRANGKTNGDDEDEESSEEQEVVAEQRSVRGQTPIFRPPSVPRSFLPPISRTSVPPMSHPEDLTRYDQSDPETSLPPIREIDEDLLVDQLEAPQRAPFSIGASLGHGVNGIFRLGWAIIQLFFGLISLITRLIGKVLGLTLDITVHKPVRWLSRADSTPFIRAALVGFIIYSAWYALNRGWLEKLIPSSRVPYRPPEAPVTNMGEFVERLMRLESALADLAQESEKSKSWIEGSRSELVGRVGALESQVHKDSLRIYEAETKFRTSTGDAIQVVRQEVESLQAQLRAHKESASQDTPAPSSDEEARVKLRALEERLGSAESGIKEALELGKNAAKVGASTGTAAAWWSKLASGNAGSALTIKSGDGQDVTLLINHLVDSSVYRLAKDVVARPDFALYSAGAQVIPGLTTQTYEIPPGGFLSQVAGFFAGSGTGAIGRPPVTALHHETNPGHCWPFSGQQGQLGIKLAAPTFISDITIDHVAKELAPDRRAAPRNMELWGFVEGKDNLEKLQEWRTKREEMRMDAALNGESAAQDVEPPVPASLKHWGEVIRVANFTYNIHAPDHIQTFAVPQEMKDLGIDFGVVALLIENNWGREDFTCLYRVRVHGQPLVEAPAPLPEQYADSVA
ncbi:hypothetical protein DAEQUDRAFT_683997 [Daedalea quercina L-15889]|uniref:SUN domain-containing protein n=1 Tax=Daedalea quercina L-15889 TaxID=1314783 RepID=A0A165TMG7_9APHY|nr:hypothetical protein DAEQUDRAFT_683997 [Daedalea quercina L-15889]